MNNGENEQGSSDEYHDGGDDTGSDADDKLVHLRPPKPCPNCGQPSTRKAFPFCSSRCANVDLNRWLSGNFVIPGRTLGDADEEES